MKRILTEKEAENFLEKKGFNVAKRATLRDIKDIKTVEKKLEYPWVMKISSTKIAHKANMGGVILNIDSQMKAQEAFEKLSALSGFEESMIQETITGEEAIIGIKNTPEFGHVIMFGKGGSKVEEERDISFRVLPVSKSEIENMIKETNFYKRLQERQIGMDLIKEQIAKIAELAKENPSLSELDLNPIFFNAKEAKIADARIIFED